MANTKDKMQGGSHDSMSGNQPTRQFEGQEGKSGSGMENQGHKQGSGKQAQQSGKSQGNLEDDEMTSGGRQGKFSDTGSPGEGQWSPGSSQESDR